MTVSFRSRAAIAACTATLLLSGCYVNTHKNGKSDDVNVVTPFGSMKVKTNDNADKIGIGLTIYPGSKPVNDDNDKNNNAADINMSFGDFHLGVKAASYFTTDSPDKVEAFYRKDMAHFGDIIKCKGDTTLGKPTQTSQGLKCTDEKDNHISTGDDHGKGIQIHGGGVSNDGNPELRAGSPTHQHIVSMQAKNGGTKIGLVLLDLPHGLDHDKGDSE